MCEQMNNIMYILLWFNVTTLKTQSDLDCPNRHSSSVQFQCIATPKKERLHQITISYVSNTFVIMSHNHNIHNTRYLATNLVPTQIIRYYLTQISIFNAEKEYRCTLIIIRRAIATASNHCYRLFCSISNLSYFSLLFQRDLSIQKS